VSRIARLELLQLTRSGLIRSVLAVFVLLTGFALWVGVQEHERWADSVAAARAEAERANAREQENVRLQRQESFNPPGAPAGQSMDASLPPAPGVIVAVGDAMQRPVSATINSNTRLDTLFKNTETGSALSASLGMLDLTWVAIVLFPLLSIALTHDLLSAERDAARLGLLRAQAGSLGRVIARRLAIRAFLPLVIVTAGAVAAVILDAKVSVVASWWLIVCLYLVLWSVVGALVSVRASTAQSSAAILLLLWLGFVVLLPAIVTLTVERAAPVPSRLSQIIAMREVQLGLQQRTSELLDRFLVDHPELSGASRTGFARSSFVAQRETEAQLEPVIARYAQMRREQGVWTTALSWISPPMLLHASLTNLSGTDGARHEAFVSQANQFAAQWRDQLRDQLFLDRLLSPEEVASLPRFQFKESTSVGRAAMTIGYLVMLIGAAIWLLSRSLVRAIGSSA
jgi:ABC-2 type transport system permease protein